MPDLPSGTVTFLFTDIEGSTRRWEADPVSMRAALVRHDGLLHSAIEAHGGHVFKTVGDAFCAAFAVAPDALLAALESQRRILDEDWNDVGGLAVRMALHTGSAEAHDGDYFGPPLNRVARLLSAGHGGQVLLSQVTQELVRDVLPSGVSMRDLGEHHLKDLYRPEHVFQVVAPDLRASFPALNTLNSRPNNLPLQPTPLVGREREIQEVEDLLRGDIRLVTLTGPGGTGKTRLGLQIAAAALDRFPDGVYFVDLAPIADPELVPSAIATALGLQGSGGRTLDDVLAEYLRTRQTLLLLDNFEQVVAAAPVVAAMLAGAQGLKIIATSRVPLHLSGEQEFPVPPLGLPDRRRLPPIEQFTQFHAVALFIQRAQAVKPDFEVTSANAPAVAEICHRLDGLPLAIELAAARIRLLPPQAMLERLEQRLSMLTGGARDRPARHQTLRNTIAWSYELLTDDEQALFRRLSVFSGGWTLDAAEMIAARSGSEEPGVDGFEVLASLVEHSLVRQYDGYEGMPRFTMLETIREYASDHLDMLAEQDEARQRHADYVVKLVEQAEPALLDTQEYMWLGRLEAEHENLRTALSWSLEHDPTLALRIVAAGWRFWYRQGYLSEGRKWLSLALERDSGEIPARRAKALDGAGVLSLAHSDLVSGRRFIEEFLELVQQLEDLPSIARGQFSRGILAGHEHDYARARDAFSVALNLYRELHDSYWIAATLNNLAVIASGQGDQDAAVRLYTESLQIARDAGNARGEMTSLQHIAWQEFISGRLSYATSLLAECTTIARRLNDQWAYAHLLFHSASISLEQGDYAESRRLTTEGLRICHDRRDELAEAYGLDRLARIVSAEGQSLLAARLFGAAEVVLEKFGFQYNSFDASLHDRYVRIGQEQVSADQWSEAWAAGRAMLLLDAVREALDLAE